MKLLKISLIAIVFAVFSTGQIHSQTDTNWTVTSSQIQGFEIGRELLKAYKAAYEQEHKTRLQDSSNYNYAITRLEKSILEIQEALKIEQALPKVIVKANPDWYWFTAGGSAVTVITYFIYKLFIKK
jgi:hypothetical protein